MVSEQAGVVRQVSCPSETFRRNLCDVCVVIVMINETAFLSITEHFLGDVGDPL